MQLKDVIICDMVILPSRWPMGDWSYLVFLLLLFGHWVDDHPERLTSAVA